MQGMGQGMGQGRVQCRVWGGMQGQAGTARCFMAIICEAAGQVQVRVDVRQPTHRRAP